VSRAPAPVVLAAPPGYSLAATIAAHGWYRLAPYRYDDDADALSTTWDLGGAAPVDVALDARDGEVVLTPGRALSAAERKALAARAAYALAFDADVSDLHRLCRAEPRLRWIARRGMGRLLRGGDLFEDALKTLLTTNCTWTQTIAMVGRVVSLAGTPAPRSGNRAFPTPAAVRALGARGLAEEVKVGYRARAVLELCDRAEGGDLSALPTLAPTAARKAIRGWFGFGPYAAASLLQLLGRNDEVVVDSWAVAQAKKHYFAGKRCTPAAIRKLYARYGAEAARVAWFDLNREHFG
jgi:3-methyladenine DNA glycosylase/8-oxoguanine DNA glycosylase